MKKKSQSTQLVFSAVLSALSLSAAVFPEAALARQTMDVDALKSYYADQLGGLIRPAELDLSKSIQTYFFEPTRLSYADMKFDPKPKFGMIEPTRFLDPEASQDLFALDVDAFVAGSGEADFAEAKRKFHSALKFDEESLFHERPYLYLSDWNSLFHPPVKAMPLPVKRYVSELEEIDFRSAESPFFTADFHRRVDEDTTSELTFGNELKYLANGDAYVEKMRLIREARSSIFVAVMSVVCDRTGIPMVEELIRRKREGVDVRIVLEGAYQKTAFRGCLNRMKKGGLNVVLSDDLIRGGKVFALMHNKFWIRDLEEAIIGGQNIFDKQNSSTGFNQRHRDGDVLVKGPAVTTAVGEFIGIWNEQKKRKNGSTERYAREYSRRMAEERAAGLRGSEHYETILSDPDTRMKGVCRVVTQGPQNDRHRLARALFHYVSAARKHAVLTTPDVHYKTPGEEGFRPTDALFESLRAGARNGLKVDIVSDGMDGGAGELSMTLREHLGRALDKDVPLKEKMWIGTKKQADQFYAKSNLEMMKPLAQIPGIRAWMHFQYIHAKHMLIDQIASVIGSFNLEQFSDSNQETSILCQDENLSKQLAPVLARDIVNSTPLIGR